MKRILFIIATLLAVFSCVEPAIEVERNIELSQTDVVIGSQGATVKVVYQINGADQGAQVSVANDAEWLTVSTDKARLIELTAEKNETGALREALVRVSYQDYEEVAITVSQTIWEDPIVLNLEETQATSVIFSVQTLDSELTWVGQVVGKEWFEEMESDEQIFQEDLSYYSLEAQNQGVPLSDYISTILNKGSFQNLKYKGLDPNSEYVIYVYGLTAEGERTTEIYSVPAVTQPPYDGPITLDVQIKEENNIMDVTVTPSHDGVYYYWNLMDRETYDSYAAQYGDDPVKVFQAYVEWDIQDLIDYEYLTTRAEYFEWYSDINEVNSQFECMALTEYIVFACKWDEDCNFEGEAAYKWHTSADVTPSSNQITVTVGDDVDQSSFYVEVKTTNSDPYVMIAEPSRFMEGMNEEQIYAHLVEDYGTFGLLNYVYEGDIAGRMRGLDPDTEYTMVVFGYKAGKQTTAMQKFTVRTVPAGPAEDCTFDFVLNEAGSNSLNITVTPSDAAHFYYWYVYSPDTTADQVRENITDLIQKSYYGDLYEFSYYELSQGVSTGMISFLAPNTGYKVAAVVMDYNTGEFLADVVFSDVYTTGEENYSPTTITATFDKFYDGDDLYDINPDAGAQYKDYAMVPVSITIDGDYKSYYYTIFEYETGLEDPAQYPDAMLYETLVYYGVYYAETVNFRAPWNKAVVIAAMAIDNEGRYSRVYRQKYTFRKYNASDISELFTKSPTLTRDVKIPYALPEMSFDLKKDRPQGDDRYNAAKMEQVRKENRIRKF
ncbi:MAG: BACON domain-containing protein [Bacteroidales bacterium]|nr:BACON domain-containing protein [Bacteroidales bacterium]MBR5862062.1 BACON domain-containing protein [Bacteroidales bacterium]